MGMTGCSFQASTSNGVTLGRDVEVGRSVGRTMVVGFVVDFVAGLGVREGAVTGNWKLVITAFDGAAVEEGTGCVGDFGATSAAQAASRTQNTKLTRRFIRRSIAVKN